MFDPTAYDNLKVILEGAVYDLDLSGELKIIERNDIVDLAKIVRRYEITYILVDQPSIKANISLEANLNQLASELLNIENQSMFGANIAISFSWNTSENTKDFFQSIKSHWGPGHIYEEKQIISSLHGSNEEMTIRFTRTMTEEMVDDLVEMFHYSIVTIKKLLTGTG